MDTISPPDEPAPPPADPSEDPVDLARELERTRLLLDGALASVRLQGMRGDGLQAALDDARNRLGQLQHSVSWRVTTPIRYARALAAGRLPTGHSFPQAARRIAEINAEEGPLGLLRRGGRMLPTIPGGRSVRRHWARIARSRQPAPSAASIDPYAAPVARDDHASLLTPAVLIVAELSIPQCAKYRVWQKQEMLRSLGWHCQVINWRELDHVTTAMQLCSHLIFYRVPAEAAVLAMIDEAERLGLEPVWEVDDLIFDEPLYRRNSNLATLEPALRDQVLAGVRLYRAAMLRCGRAIASTATLAQCMRDAGVGHVQVVENALDSETLEIARRLRESRPPRAAGAPTTIVYGSGTKTHDADFACAAPAILRLLRRHPNLRLRIVGELTLPDSYDEVRAQIDAIPGTDYRNYLRLLAEADIAIAPLEATLFNDAKSNIKFQEAAILGMPAVCSPARSFADVVVDDRNGLLARDEAGWERALERLILDPDTCRRLGTQALADVTDRYAPERIAADQVASLFGSPPARRPAGLRILSANIFFAPQSFGGATIVAQELAARLQAASGVELCVFTSRPPIEGRPSSLLRYAWNGIPVFATSLSSAGDQVVQLDNPAITHVFGQVLDALRPDVVHAHSIQGFGASIVRLCQERGIPTVITLHDPWWLCDRHFMVRGDNRYCFQTAIDLKVCQTCVPHARHLSDRMRIMMGVLRNASLLLSPSETHRQLYLANGLSPERLRVNRNGIRMPSAPRPPRPAGGNLRFGYVGGNEPIKGFHLIRKAFEALERPDWELVLVDNTLNLGFRSIDVSRWEVDGAIHVVPAYTQSGMDAFFASIDVLLFPSQWKESFGLSVREALARDVWVIATDGGGQSEEIRDGVNGTLIPLDGRHERLLDAVTALLETPERVRGFRNPHADELASYDSQCDELLGMIRTLLSGTAPASPHAGPS